MTSFQRLCTAATCAVTFACGSTSVGDEAPVEACDRACLIELATGIATGEQPLPDDARFTENGTEVPVRESWLAGATDLNIHGDYADEAESQVVVIGTGNDADGRPTIFGLRLKHEAGETTEAELILAHDGEASLFPMAIPVQRLAAFSEVVAPAARTEPSRMIALANAYFDGIEVDSGADVPVTDDCNRIENGVQITNTERSPNLKCNSLEGFDYITEVRERRYPIVDEERGVVVGLVAFYIPGGDYPRVMNGMMTTRHYDPRALFLMEAFKVEDGEIRLIEATMRNMPLGATMGWPAAD